MTTLHEAAQQALEALEEIHHGNMTPMAEGNWNKAIEALRSALAQQGEWPNPNEYDSPISDFKEGQWWVIELDEMAKQATSNQKRAVAVVHHMLRAALAQQGEQPVPAIKLNRRGGARRNKPSTAALTPDQVREARVLRVEQKKPIKELMAKYSASRSTLRNALYGLGYYEGIL